MVQHRSHRLVGWWPALVAMAVTYTGACSPRPEEPTQVLRQALQGTIPSAGGTVTGTTAGSSSFTGAGGDCTAVQSDQAPEHVWAWTPTVSGPAIIHTCGAGTHFDTVLYLSPASNGSGQLACVNDTAGCEVGVGDPNQPIGSRIQLTVTAGTTYYIYVDGSSSSQQGDYSLTVEAPTLPKSATVIPPAGGIFTGTTAGSSSFTSTCSAYTGESPERVYVWTPTKSGSATIHTCGAASTRFDTVMYVSTASDGSAQIACVDDSPGCDVFDATDGTTGPWGSRLKLSVTAGTTYYIYVDGYNADYQGQYSLTVEAPLTVPPQGGTVGDTTSGGSGFTATCALDSSGSPEKVFTWVPPRSGQATISTCSASTQFDTVLYVSGASDGSGQLACADNTWACNTAAGADKGSVVTVPVTAGTPYYIYVDGYNSSQNGYFNLNVDPPACASAADCADSDPCTTESCNSGVCQVSAREQTCANTQLSLQIVRGQYGGDICVTGVSCSSTITLSPGTHTIAAPGTRGSDGTDTLGRLLVKPDGTVVPLDNLTHYFQIDTTNRVLTTILKPVRFVMNGYGNTIDVSGVGSCHSARDTIWLFPERKYTLATADAPALIGDLAPQEWLSPAGYGMSLDSDGHVFLDTDSKRYFDGWQDGGTVLTLKTTPVRVDLNGYGGEINFWPFARVVPSSDTVRLIVGRRYKMMSAYGSALTDDPMAPGGDWFAPGDHAGFSVRFDGSVAMDAATKRFFVNWQDGFGVPVLNTEPLHFVFNGFPGRIALFQVGDVSLARGDTLPVLKGRRYCMQTPDLGTLDGLNSYPLNCATTRVNFDGTVGLDSPATDYLRQEQLGDTTLIAKTVTLNFDFNGYTQRLDAWETATATPATPTMSLLVNRRYSFQSMYAINLAGNSYMLSPAAAPVKITQSGAAPPEVSFLDGADPDGTGSHLTIDGTTLRAKVARVRVSAAGYGGHFCLDAFGCGPDGQALERDLIVGRKYDLVGFGYVTVAANGTCPDPGYVVGPTPVQVSCGATMEAVQVDVQRLIGAVPTGIPALVDVYRGTTLINTIATNVNGVATIILPNGGPVRFRAQWGGADWWSSTNDDCSASACPNKTITVTGVDVDLVVPGYARYQPPVQVYAYTGASWSTLAGTATTGNYGVPGRATIGLPQGSSYQFQTTIAGKTYTSDEECSGSCSTARIKIGDECFDVDNSSGTPCKVTDLCNVNICQNHVCTFVEPVATDDGDTCTLNICDPATGQISHPPDLSPETEGVACEWGEGPDPIKTCQKGVCKPNMIPYGRAPGEATPAQEPLFGDAYFGSVKGEMSVSQTGAATYTVPISVPPGIAGMAPNLSLVYNSQAGNGIAGQGWVLSGLSMIHRCPKTRVQDGWAQPINLATSTRTDAADYRAGVCLDGKRLLERADGDFYLESDEFSTIRDLGSASDPLNYKGFVVVTKTGEIRYYGNRTDSRLTQSLTGAVWMLDKVMDPWGNYFEIHYNNDNADFLAEGIKVTKIKYTGNDSAGVSTFNNVTFEYEPRNDVRHARIGSLWIPEKDRLTVIKTDAGTYTLKYLENDSSQMLPSRLESIKFCEPASGDPNQLPKCLDDLIFGWDAGTYGWESAPSYALPARIDRPSAEESYGTQFVDLNEDGLVDFIQAKQGVSRQTWKNTGQGFVHESSWDLKADLVKMDGKPGHARLADLDGDGLLDLIETGTSPGGCEIYAGWEGARCADPAPNVWLNRTRTSQGWEQVTFPVLDEENIYYLWGHINLTDTKHYAVADMNGDGRADLVHFGDQNAIGVSVIYNTPEGWNPAPYGAYDWKAHNQGPFGLGTNSTCTLRDVNRDGLPDAVCVNGTAVNTQGVQRTYKIGSATHVVTDIWEAAGADISSAYDQIPPEARYHGDIDGDGLYDFLTIHPLVAQCIVPDFDNPPCAKYRYSETQPRGISVGTGGGYISGPAQYLNDLGNFLPTMFPDGNTNTPDNGVLAKHVLAMADLNADGLVDVVLNQADGGQLLVNTGSTWVDRQGRTGRQESGNSDGRGVPAVPSDNFPDGYPGDPTNAAAFVDLNGDGVTDLVRTIWARTDAERSRAWLNTFSPPVITTFPNGQAKNSVLSYSVITAYDESPDKVYADDAPLAAGTNYLALPLRVVKSMSSEDGTATGTMFSTTYKYHSLRGSSTGRGPQGFASMDVMDSRSGIKTTTGYAQAYPYTGMTTAVMRSKGVLSLGMTFTQYCDNITPASTPCTPPTGPAGGAAYTTPAGPLFVYPKTVTDVSFLYGTVAQNLDQTPLMAVINTFSEFRYDDRGNPTRTTVTIDNDKDIHKTDTVNTYGTAGSTEQLMGKVKETTVTKTLATKLTSGNPPVTSEYSRKVHKVSFDYNTSSPSVTLSLTPGDLVVRAVPLAKQKSEPGAGYPIELHTAYGYDEFGNSTVATTCQSTFGSCEAGATNPAFRTTTTSYDPAHFNAPQVSGLLPSLNYGKGRFPVRTTVEVSENVKHTEYFAYDPIKAVLLQQTAPNGLHTRYTYGPFGDRLSETLRYGSTAPLETTVAHRLPPTNQGTVDYKTVIVATPPGGVNTRTWTYLDAFGRTVRKRTRSFGGDFVETDVSTFDSLGRTVITRKPRLASGGPIYNTTFHYDPLGRPDMVTQQLGQIGGPGTPSVQDVTTTDYYGLSITTERFVNGMSEFRTEEKNVQGKVASVTIPTGEDPSEQKTEYTYDADGNLTDTKDPKNNVIHVVYDARGRKTLTLDPDMGQWTYTYNGFGDLLTQTDAKNQTWSMTYDQLGRMLTKADASGNTAQWVYSTSGSGAGNLLATVSAPEGELNLPCTIPGTTVTGGNRTGRSFKYNALGELEEVIECVDGNNFQTNYEYDEAGRQSYVTYPEVNNNRTRLQYNYTSTGYLFYVSDTSDDLILWAATDVNAMGQVTGERMRNGVDVIHDRSDSTGWLMSSLAIANADGEKTIQGWSYGYDQGGNLRRRMRSDQVNTADSVETFDYDPLNRVTSSTVAIAAKNYTKTQSYHYDWIGNITQKDGKTYTYSGCGAGPHAVCTVGGGPARTYDPNGNMTADGGRTLSYTALNKVAQISANGTTIRFAYGPDGNRVVQSLSGAAGTERTIYVGLGATGKSLYERTTRGDGTTEHVQFMYAGGVHGGNAFALRVVKEQSTATKYYHFDHLGSVTAMSDETGHVIGASGGENVGVLGYDPWGARRQPDGVQTEGDTFEQQVGHREFTGHETIPDVGLINMNGRVYDPLLARFISPDPNIQFAADPQSYNRYSYVLNNPLRNTDPTGFYASTPIWYDMMSAGGFLLAGAACAASGGGVCTGFLILDGLLMSTTASLASGATVDQVVVSNVISALGSFVGTGIASTYGKEASDIGIQILSGELGGALTAAMNTAVSGDGSHLGENVVRGVAMGALMAAASTAIRESAVSAASTKDSGASSTRGRSKAGGGRPKGYGVAARHFACMGVGCGEYDRNDYPSRITPEPVLQFRIGPGGSSVFLGVIGLFASGGIAFDTTGQFALYGEGGLLFGGGGSLGIGSVREGAIPPDGWYPIRRGTLGLGPLKWNWDIAPDGSDWPVLPRIPQLSLKLKMSDNFNFGGELKTGFEFGATGFNRPQKYWPAIRARLDRIDMTVYSAIY